MPTLKYLWAGLDPTAVAVLMEVRALLTAAGREPRANRRGGASPLFNLTRLSSWTDHQEIGSHVARLMISDLHVARLCEPHVFVGV